MNNHSLTQSNCYSYASIQNIVKVLNVYTFSLTIDIVYLTRAIKPQPMYSTLNQSNKHHIQTTTSLSLWFELHLRSASSVNCLFGQRVSDTQEVSATDHHHWSTLADTHHNHNTRQGSLTQTQKSCQIN